MNDKIFVFDMDGVIVDTRNKLYDLYIEFVRSFGKEADLEECQELDGLKLTEIIIYAKKKHDLPFSEEELTKIYNQEIEKVYFKVNLINKVEKILTILKKNGCKLALASSAKREYIDIVLQRFKLEKYFEFIVSGDDVLMAKPSPEIYNCIRNRFGNKEYYVIEDSAHGIAAATSAGMTVIFFNSNNQKSNKLAGYTAKKMDEINNILKEIERDCKTVALADKIKISLCNDKILISEEDREIVESYWDLQKAQNSSLFNGTILSYSKHHFEGETLHIECVLTEYRCYLAQLAGKVSLNIKPLAVSGIILDENNNTLLAKRSGVVTEYKEHYEFVPSGGLSTEDINGKEIQYYKRIVSELEEETTLSSGDILRMTPLGLILDQKDKVFDICIKINLKNSLKKYQSRAPLIRSEEYSQPYILSTSEVERFFERQKIVPTSINLFSTITRLLK